MCEGQLGGAGEGWSGKCHQVVGQGGSEVPLRLLVLPQGEGLLAEAPGNSKRASIRTDGGNANTAQVGPVKG